MVVAASAEAAGAPREAEAQAEDSDSRQVRLPQRGNSRYNIHRILAKGEKPTEYGSHYLTVAKGRIF
ncbi:hypothetical protein J42TS3_30190 [Paenibacillus vini]|uniref:Uncharacterized protein n=1 Tax=Paenibacillus vini TaxID=1476024 RepID=A0ABQ4MDC3_9BACL|nr:hypothetical protein J42TS3_30190 [Paenibacillus vini]